MKITKQQMLTARAVAYSLPLPLGNILLPSTVTAIILLRVELDRLATDYEQSRRAIVESAKEGVEGFDEGLMAYNKNPDAHPEFAAKLAQVDERFIPANNALLAEEVEVTRALTPDHLTDIVGFLMEQGDAFIDFPRLPRTDGSIKWPVDDYISLIASTIVI